jgi:hypothetical protein
MVSKRAKVSVSEIPAYKIERLRTAFNLNSPLDYLFKLGWSMGLTNEEVTDLINIRFLGVRKEIKVLTEDTNRYIAVEDRCPTKVWFEHPKTLKIEQVERGVWEAHHTIGNVICEF